MHLVKLLTTEDGDKVENPKWCLVVDFTGANMALCSGQVFGMGESEVEYDEKRSERGITCPKCIGMIKEFKAIKQLDHGQCSPHRKVQWKQNTSSYRY